MDEINTFFSGRQRTNDVATLFGGNAYHFIVEIFVSSSGHGFPDGGLVQELLKLDSVWFSE